MDFDSDGLKTILFTFLFHFYSIIYAIRARSARTNFFNPFLRGFFFYFSTNTLFGMRLGSTSHVIFPCAYVVFHFATRLQMLVFFSLDQFTVLLKTHFSKAKHSVTFSAYYTKVDQRAIVCVLKYIFENRYVLWSQTQKNLCCNNITL